MKKGFVLIVFIMVFAVSCIGIRRPMEHYLITNSIYDSLDAPYDFERFIIIFPEYSDDVIRITNDLNDGFDYGFKREIGKCKNKEDSLFLLAIYYLTEYSNKRKSTKAILEQLPKNAFHGQVALLLLDCNLRLGIKMDYQAEYQRMFDQAENPLMKKLIKTHYRFYKYESQELLRYRNDF